MGLFDLGGMGGGLGGLGNNDFGLEGGKGNWSNRILPGGKIGDPANMHGPDFPQAPPSNPGLPDETSPGQFPGAGRQFSQAEGQGGQQDSQIPNAAGPSTVGSGTAQTGMKQPMMSDLSQSKQQGGRLSFMDTLAQIESSGGTQVRNLISPKHVGKYQMSREAFKRFSNGGDINDPAAQESAARAYTDYNRSSLKQMFGRDPTDAEVYLSYNQGLAGAHRMIGNPNVPAGQLVKPQNIVNQGGDPAAPASQFMQMISAKWNDLSRGSGMAGGF